MDSVLTARRCPEALPDSVLNLLGIPEVNPDAYQAMELPKHFPVRNRLPESLLSNRLLSYQKQPQNRYQLNLVILEILNRAKPDPRQGLGTASGCQD